MTASAAFATAVPVTHKRQLVAWLESGVCPPESACFSTACDVFVHDRVTHEPVPYAGDNGLLALLDELQAFHWTPAYEDARVIGLNRGLARVTLGPGGQLVMTSGYHTDVHAAAMGLFHQFDELGSVCRVLGQRAVAIGFAPKARREQMPRIPRQSYHILAAHMSETGALGLDMLARTAAIRTALTFSSERDMVAKMRVGLALQPLVGVLFSCSPFRDGRPSGDLSFRNRVWQHTDPTRCAYLEFVFSEGFGFEAYVDWALSIPLTYVRRDACHFDLTGSSFVDFMHGRLEQVPGLSATLTDWENHLSTLVPPVRLTRLIEMRGADMGDPQMALALSALWVGLLGDRVALDEAMELTRTWSAFDRMQMHTDGPKLGLGATMAGRNVREIATDIIAIARRGLARRARADDLYQDETTYLVPLQAILDHGLTQAEDLLRRYFDDWNGDIDPVFEACRLV